MNTIEFKTHPVIWLTGQTGAGKTTIARMLWKKIGGVILDGDEMRESISEKEGFSQHDRTEHNLRVARLAMVLSQYSPVLVAVIAPFKEVRSRIDAIVHPIWIYVERDLPITENTPYEVPKHCSLKVNSDNQTTREQVNQIVDLLSSIKK